MRLTEYHQLIVDEFGESKGKWISHSHVLPDLGATPDELIERGVDPRKVWLSLCNDFDVPQGRRLGVDYPGKERHFEQSIGEPAFDIRTDVCRIAVVSVQSSTVGWR